MASKSPSLLALLGLAAVAGYQNRDKLAELFGQPNGAPDNGQGLALTGAAQDFRQTLGQGMGGIVSVLSQLVDQAKAANPRAAEAVESWVGRGQNQPLPAQDLQSALGDDLLAELSSRTGLSQADLLARLGDVLPQTVDTLTPEGAILERRGVY